MAEIKSINELLSMNLNIPDYQRPYKWDDDIAFSNNQTRYNKNAVDSI